MTKNKRYTVHFRRKREGRTDYRRRLRLLLSNRPRLVVRKSLNNIYASIVEYAKNGDRAVLTASSMELEKLGWNINKGNLPSSYLVGLLLGTKLKKENIKNIKGLVLDIGLQKSVKGSRIYALLAGAIDSGLDISYNPSILPNKDRLSGKHIADYAKMKGSKNDFQLGITKHFEEMKKKIIGENGKKEERRSKGE